MGFLVNYDDKKVLSFGKALSKVGVDEFPGLHVGQVLVARDVLDMDDEGGLLRNELFSMASWLLDHGPAVVQSMSEPLLWRSEWWCTTEGWQCWALYASPDSLEAGWQLWESPGALGLLALGADL